MLPVIPTHALKPCSQQTGKLACMLLLLLSSAMATAGSLVERSKVSNPTEIWSAWGGQAQFRFAPMVLRDMRLQVISSGQVIKGAAGYDATPLQMGIANLGSLNFHAPFGHFEGFVDGRLTINQPMRMRLAGGREVSWQSMVISPMQAELSPALQISDGNGNQLFIMESIHVYVDQIADQLTMERMDIYLSADLAARLGAPAMAKAYLGELALGSQLNIPDGAVTEIRGGSCGDRPKWPTDGFIADVGLTAMGAVSDVGQLTTAEGTFELVAPSSSLVNLQGLDGADVPWFTKFTGPFPPYNNDQHPYLIWNMYRIDNNGKMEQIGRSGLKHAWLTINSSCTINCGDGGIPGAGGHILWPGCGDVYGVGNNNNPGDIGPRDEINPLTGEFTSTGSFFDQNGDGVQDNNSDDTGENRMQVLREDMQVAGANYFFESWYVIRDDVNIYNTMGFRSINPNSSGGNFWSYSPLGSFTNGPVIDEWVVPSTNPATGSQNVSFFDETIGHMKLAVKTSDLGGGLFRYDYMLMNFDVNDGISALTFAGLGDAEPGTIDFHDVDQDAGNDWSVSQAPLRFAAAAGNQMPWGNGYTFSFVAGPPTTGEVTVTIGDSADATRDQTLDIISPSLSEVFKIDGFESPDS